MHLTSLCLFVYSLYCAALTVNPWKISWHGINGVLIINNEPATPSCCFLTTAGKALRQLIGERVNKCDLICDQRKHTCKWAKTKQKRTSLAPLRNAPAPAALQHKALVWHFITREIAKQRAPAPSLFPSHFHFLWFAQHRPHPNMPPQPRQILCVLWGKVLTHSTKASLSCCVGIVVQHRPPPSAK